MSRSILFGIMGCGASSKAVPASDAEKVEMFTFALKEMMIDVGTYAITNGAEVKVAAPVDQVGNIKPFVQKIRDAAAAAKTSLNSGGAASGAADKASSAVGGGLMGGVMAKAAAAADAVADAAGGAVGAGLDLTLNAGADAIQRGLDSLDNEFNAVGLEVAAAKADAIIETYKSVIHDRTILNPQVLVRGASPHGPGEAAAMAKNAVSNYITDSAKADLVAKLLPVCKEAVQGCKACKAWKALIVAYNSANESIGKLGEAGAAFKQDPITLDIENYIVEQIVVGYGAKMTEKEAANRKDPNSVTVPKNTTTFVRCWDIQGIAYAEFTKTHYNDFKFNNQ